METDNTIRTQLELFPEEVKKGQKTKTIKVRQSFSKRLKGWNDVMASIAKTSVLLIVNTMPV